jgi:hypothetical protein
MTTPDLAPLLALRGVTRVFRFEGGEVTTFAKTGPVPSHPSTKALGRGLLQAARDARSSPKRLAVHCDRGRLLFQFLQSGAIVGVHATLDSEVPRLHLELDALTGASSVNMPANVATVPPPEAQDRLTPTHLLKSVPLVRESAPYETRTRARVTRPETSASSEIASDSSDASSASGAAAETSSPLREVRKPRISLSAESLTRPAQKPVAFAGQVTGTSPEPEYDASELISIAVSAPTFPRLEIMHALTRIAQMSTRFFGKRIITNYFRSAKPSLLAAYQITDALEFELPEGEADEAELAHVQTWLRAVIKRAMIVVTDFEQHTQTALGTDAAWIIPAEGFAT